MRTVTIVGIGRVGGAFAIALSRAGFEVTHLVSKNTEAARHFRSNLLGNPVVCSLSELQILESDILFVTTQDSQIHPVAKRLAVIPAPHAGIAFHASGALASLELSPLAEAGWRTGSLHPLVSISDPKRGAESLNGTYFAVEGEKHAVRSATEIVKALGGKPFEIRTDQKVLYHAAAVVACGHLVALIETSQRMLSRCGVDRETSQKVLIPLIESTVTNLRENSPAEALTGPFARADVATVRRHLQKIEEIADEDVDGVYRLLGLISTDISASKGADPAKIQAIRDAIKLDKSNSR